MQRRTFLTHSLGMLGVGATTARLPRPDAEGLAQNARRDGAEAVRIGGPIFVDSTDPEELAQAHRRLGYRAAYCPKVDVKDTARVTAIADAFRTEGVVIAEVGRWVNLLSDRFFDAAVENARTIIDAVKPARAKFCYEMMGWSLPDGPASFLRMLEAIDRPAFGVHLDPCNLVNTPARFYRNTDLLNECFDVLGPWIVSCHAKDLTWDVEMNIHFREVRPGAGSMDYTRYLRRLAALPQQPPLMLEHLPNAEEYDKGRQYLIALGQRLGISVD